MSVTCTAKKMIDRTNEFESSVNSFSAGKFPVFSANKQAVAFAYSMGTPAGLFMERATALSRAFPAVNSKLESLLKRKYVHAEQTFTFPF